MSWAMWTAPGYRRATAHVLFPQSFWKQQGIMVKHGYTQSTSFAYLERGKVMWECILFSFSPPTPNISIYRGLVIFQRVLLIQTVLLLGQMYICWAFDLHWQHHCSGQELSEQLLQVLQGQSWWSDNGIILAFRYVGLQLSLLFILVTGGTV